MNGAPKVDDETARDHTAGRQVVFVTDDPDLLSSDVFSCQVVEGLRGRQRDLSRAARNVSDAKLALERAVRAYKNAEGPGIGGRQNLRAETPSDKAGVGTDSGAGTETAEETPTATEAASGAISTAVDLMQLLAVDYTVSAVDVNADSALLARLTAGSLSSTRKHDQVLLDGYALATNSPTLAVYRDLLVALTQLDDGISELNAAIAPVADSAAIMAVGAAKAKEQWLGAVKPPAISGKKGAETPPVPQEVKVSLKAEYQRLEKGHLYRVEASAPGKAVIDAGSDLLVTVRAELSVLLTPGGSGISPLQRACSRDRFRKDGQGSEPVTQVLVVQATHAGADIVTRRSVLGASGRVGYLAGANGSWVMVSPDGAVLGGGAVEHASHLTHDLASGESKKGTVKDAGGEWETDDPLAKNEAWVRLGVMLLAAAIALMSVAAAWSVFFQD